MLSFGRLLLIVGLIFLVLGGLIYLAARLNLPINRIPLGHLPGDIRIQSGNFTCIFPLATSILLSVVLTILLSIIARLLNK